MKNILIEKVTNFPNIPVMFIYKTIIFHINEIMNKCTMGSFNYEIKNHTKTTIEEINEYMPIINEYIPIINEEIKRYIPVHNKFTKYSIYSLPKKIIIRAGGIIILNNKILIVRQVKWSIPKGYIEFGEYPHIAAQREIYEEVGLDYIINSNTNHIDIGDIKYYLLKSNVENENLITNDPEEIKEIKWVSEKNLYSMNNLNYSLNIIKYNWREIIKLFKTSSI